MKLTGEYREYNRTAQRIFSKWSAPFGVYDQTNETIQLTSIRTETQRALEQARGRTVGSKFSTRRGGRQTASREYCPVARERVSQGSIRVSNKLPRAVNQSHGSERYTCKLPIIWVHLRIARNRHHNLKLLISGNTSASAHAGSFKPCSRSSKQCSRDQANTSSAFLATP